jgi:hypothetical protein
MSDRAILIRIATAYIIGISTGIMIALIFLSR